MEYPTSLNALLATTGLKYRWVNIGRGIRNINNELFDSIEACQSPYPWPYAYQAWFALIVWNPSQDQQHTIWFFKLPLDEQGLIIPQARDALILELLTMLGITSTEPNNQNQDSRYTFEPDDEQKAAIHAKVSRILAEPPSLWYQPVVDYLSNNDTDINWSTLGLQGFADLIERISESKVASLLADAIPWIAPPVFEAVCGLLQNKKIPPHLAAAVTQRITQALDNSSENELPDSFFSNGLRALTQAEPDKNVVQCIQAVLQSPRGVSSAILQSIGIYCWATLKRENLMKDYLDNLASINEGQALFNQQVSDLMFVPTMRPIVLAEFRNPQRSERLGVAIGALMSRTTH